MVVDRRAANDHQLGTALFDISHLDRLSLCLEPTPKSFRGGKGAGVVHENGQGRQVQAEVAGKAPAEDQLFADDNMIGESDLGVEHMKGRRIGAAKVDRQLRVVSDRFSVEAKINTLGFEKFGAVPLETSSDDEPLFIKPRNDNALGSWPRAVEPLPVPSQQPSFLVKGACFQEGRFESGAEVDFGSPGSALELGNRLAVQSNLDMGDRPGDRHLDRMDPDHQTDQERKKVDHQMILREPRLTVRRGKNEHRKRTQLNRKDA